MRLLQGGLKSLCINFDTEVKKLEDVDAGKFSVTKFQADEQYREDILKYCRQDVQAMKSLLYKFYTILKQIFDDERHQSITMYDMKSTIASSALHLF